MFLYDEVTLLLRPPYGEVLIVLRMSDFLTSSEKFVSPFSSALGGSR